MLIVEALNFLPKGSDIISAMIENWDSIQGNGANDGALARKWLIIRGGLRRFNDV